jgi:tRNA pseudouridine55 synthase
MTQSPQLNDGPSGILLIDKATDMTSHDVVAIARRSFKTKKIGHCGTLDPMATGLLILVLGRATKLQDSLMAEHKTYEGTLTLGVSTSTQDKEGEVIQTLPVPELSEAEIRSHFDVFLGDFEQIPPMVSAIKQNGVPLYKLARKGQEVERKPRAVSVHRYQINSITLPDIAFTIHCTKGFYVRTYANDLGERMGCGGHLSALRRTQSGKLNVSQAITVQDLKQMPHEWLLQQLIPISQIHTLIEPQN